MTKALLAALLLAASAHALAQTAPAPMPLVPELVASLRDAALHDDIAWDMIRLAHMTVSVMAVIPMQDLMDLGNEARMNYPGRLGGNWQWRYTEPMLTDVIAYRLAELTELYGREIVDTEPEPAYRIEVEEP